MKNQTKRVEDAKAASARKTKRPRIGEQKRAKAPSPEEVERAKAHKLMRVDSTVWDIINAAKIAAAKAEAAKAGDPFANPFKTERERILFNKQNFGHLTLRQAFAAAAGEPIPADVDINVGNEVPAELHVGDIIDLTIARISKEGVTFNSGVHKEVFSTRNNLAHFGKFAKVLPVHPVQAKVLEAGGKTTIVDLFSPLIDGFVLPRAARPWIQNRVFEQAVPVLVKNLRLVKGGYMGQAVIPTVSDFVGEDFAIEAFIPGSQIVLNTTNDFDQFVGQDVHAFIMSYGPKPFGRGMSLVCSVKSYLRHCGNMNLRQLHNMWCDAGAEWNTMSDKVWTGTITGVLNSAKKCGVFVEIPELNITGMIPKPADELVEYATGTEIEVKFKTLEEEMVYNDAVGQMQRMVPFEIADGAIKRVNVKPILEQA